MKELVIFLAVTVNLCIAHRAIPIDTRKEIENMFSSINRGIKWDDDHQLGNIAGRYASCKRINDAERFDVDPSLSPDLKLEGVMEVYPGPEVHRDAVIGYLTTALQQWTQREPYRSKIERADLFGCGVRPGCRDRSRGTTSVVIACVFNSGDSSKRKKRQAGIELPAKAFTPEQYKITEGELGIDWDTSHYLENISGLDTKCTMVNAKRHKFPHANSEAEINGIIIDGIYGSSPNMGSTQNAMLEIMNQWASEQKKQIQDIATSGVGCSVIPDCMLGNQMWVVVSCLYSADIEGDEDQAEEPHSGSLAKAFTPEQYALTEAELDIVWDRSHYLENLSGRETQCSMVTSNQHIFTEAEREAALENIRIDGIYGYAPNQGSTQDAMLNIMQYWTKAFGKKISDLGQSGVGCSVIPDCVLRGQMWVVVSCLYSEELQSEQAEEPVGDIQAQAFTPEQYVLAEGMLEINWDRSHYLENLSGRETDCSMITKKEHQYLYANQEASSNNIVIDGIFGSAPNRGDTQEAMEVILNRWNKQMGGKLQSLASQGLGCSLIPDCVFSGQMWVVISCLYSDDVTDIPDPNDEPIPAPKAKAFTKEQYILAERELGIEWDREHYLENLSGTETDCSMIGQKNYPFLYVEQANKDKENAGALETLYGYSVNKGTTQNAMELILKSWNKKRGNKLSALSSSEVGCSLIPECMLAQEMFVVISCVYRT